MIVGARTGHQARPPIIAKDIRAGHNASLAGGRGSRAREVDFPQGRAGDHFMALRRPARRGGDSDVPATSRWRDQAEPDTGRGTWQATSSVMVASCQLSSVQSIGRAVRRQHAVGAGFATGPLVGAGGAVVGAGGGPGGVRRADSGSRPRCTALPIAVAAQLRSGRRWGTRRRRGRRKAPSARRGGIDIRAGGVTVHGPTGA